MKDPLSTDLVADCEPVPPPIRMSWTLEELEEKASTYMREEYGLPRDLPDEESKDRWRERFGLLLHFVQWGIWDIGKNRD